MKETQKLQDAENIKAEFIELCEEIVGLLAQENLQASGYTPGAPFFEALPRDRKLQVLQYLNFYKELCAEHVKEGDSMWDNQGFTWRALKKCKLTPTPDLLGMIQDNSVVQFYNTENVQIFRTLRFFELCSYTLEDLYCREWWQLFVRKNLSIKS